MHLCFSSFLNFGCSTHGIVGGMAQWLGRRSLASRLP